MQVYEFAIYDGSHDEPLFFFFLWIKMKFVFNISFFFGPVHYL